MKESSNIIETICNGGHGGEANILVQLRNKFPGIGGEIKTQQVVATALREEYNKLPGTGHRLFFKHVILKKLDDYFCRIKKYEFPHITRPLGSISGDNGKPYEAYLYEWAFGTDGFPWEYQNPKKNNDRIILDEFDELTASFLATGIDLHSDITDADNAHISQNIVHQLNHLNYFRLNCLWKRIDFGPKSININYEKLKKFLIDNSCKLENVLGIKRYQLLLLAHQYILNGEKMAERDKGKLEILIGDYRTSSLRHKTAEMINPMDTYSNLNVSQGKEKL